MQKKTLKVIQKKFLFFTAEPLFCEFWFIPSCALIFIYISGTPLLLFALVRFNVLILNVMTIKVI